MVNAGSRKWKAMRNANCRRERKTGSTLAPRGLPAFWLRAPRLPSGLILRWRSLVALARGSEGVLDGDRVAGRERELDRAVEDALGGRARRRFFHGHQHPPALAAT